MQYDSNTKCNKGKQNSHRRGPMGKEMMYCCDFYLFKVGFNQIINRLSFMRNGCFVLAVSRIEKQSGEGAFKQSVDGITCCYVCDFLFLPKCSSILGVRCRCV